MTASALTPRARASRTTASASAWFERALTTTSAPSPASFNTVARPILRPEPVTRATFPSSLPISAPPLIMFETSRERSLGMLLRDVTVREIRHQRRRDDRDDRTEEDIDGDHIARSGRREERGRDERRGAAGDDRSELIADRTTAVAQPRREAFRDQRGLRAVHQVVRHKGQNNAEKYPGRHHRVQHREVDEAEYSGRDRADYIDALAAEPV